MFSALHNGSNILILEKASLTLKSAQVQSISAPRANITHTYPFGSNNVVDIVAVSNGETINIPEVPLSLSVTTTSNGLIVCESNETMDAELENIQRSAMQHYENRDGYKATAERCAVLRKELNPRLAKEEEQNEKISKLESSLEEMKSMLMKALNDKIEIA